MKLSFRSQTHDTNKRLIAITKLSGAGKYQLLHSLLMLATLFAAILEMIGVAFVLPAAACDLNVPDNLKGIITSLPNIG